MDKLIQELEKLNQKIDEVNTDLKAIIQDMGRIQPIWGDERDNKNEDSNVEHEQ